MSPDIENHDLNALADWMEANVEVTIAPGVDPADIEYGVLDPDNVRGLTDSDLDELSEIERFQLSGLVDSWTRWRGKDRDSDDPVYQANLGTSPWRERRRDDPPTVPVGRPDLVWMEWMNPGQFHRAIPDGNIPVVGQAGDAVLTTVERARDLGRYACPDCFDMDNGYASITDEETGIRTTVNTDEIGEAPDEVLEELNTMAGELEEMGDEESESE